MNIPKNTFVRRAFIVLTIVPFTVFVTFQGAWNGIRHLYATAALQWKAAETL